MVKSNDIFFILATVYKSMKINCFYLTISLCCEFSLYFAVNFCCNLL